MGRSSTLYPAVRALPFVVLAFAGCWSASQGDRAAPASPDAASLPAPATVPDAAIPPPASVRPDAAASADVSVPDAASPADALTATTRPVKVFIDTDLVWDPGDVAALVLAHGLADQCEIEIVGVTAVTTASSAAPAADAINTYYGRPSIPIGVLKGASFLDRNGYSKAIADQLGTTRYKSSADAPDATQVFREVLARQPDRSVVVVSIGPLRNLARFVKSGPDVASPLSGKELIQQKVKLLSAMAGVFADIGAFGGRVTKEWNVEQDAQAARDVVDSWPTPIMFSGFEVGWYSCPDTAALKASPARSPMRIALGNADPVPCQAGNGRPGWDQTSLLYAARGLGTLWKGEPTGRVDVDVASSGNTWAASPDRHQGFLANVGINARDSEAGNRAKLQGTLTKALSDLEVAAGTTGACKAKR
jgi:inosine-uridine nucleoside N-ribohydrolase